MTSVYVEDFPVNLSGSGEARRKIILHIRGSTGAALTTVADTLTDYVANVGRIVGQSYCTIGSSVSATALTWSGVVLTYPDNVVAADLEVGVICEYT